jgi:hypothetical protein
MTLLDHLRDFLIDEGLVRDPRVAGPLPPFWRHPAEGVPAPGEGGNATEIGSTLTVGGFLVGGVPSPRHEGFLRTDGVELVIRATKVPLVVAFERDLREVLNDRRDLDLAGLTVHESLLFRDLQPLDTVTSSTGHVYTFVTEYLLTTTQPATV